MRALLAWLAASAASALFGATAFLALTFAYGRYDPGFALRLWAGLAIAGAAIALTVGGGAALLAVALARVVKPPRPWADMAAGAAGAVLILLGVRAFVVRQMEAPLDWPELGPVFAIPLAAGALAGWVYWRLALKRGADA